MTKKVCRISLITSVNSQLFHLVLDGIAKVNWAVGTKSGFYADEFKFRISCDWLWWGAYGDHRETMGSYKGNTEVIVGS